MPKKHRENASTMQPFDVAIDQDGSAHVADPIASGSVLEFDKHGQLAGRS